MKAYNDFSDERLRGGCVYCNQAATTRDHIPAKAFLNKPYPANLHVVPSCKKCNNSFSKDEAYVAYLIKYISEMQTNDEYLETETTLSHSGALQKRLLNATHCNNGEMSIDIEVNRVKNVITKFAVAHMLYEFGEKRLIRPDHISFAFINQMNSTEIDKFNKPISEELFPEIGSRWMQRVVETGSDWVIVQLNKYRYYLYSAPTNFIRIVIGELLYCEVMWENV